MRVAICFSVTTLVFASCSGSDDGAAAKAKAAAELVQCKNEQEALKDQVAQCKGALAKAQSAATVKLAAVEVGSAPIAKPQERRMEGNVNPDQVVKVVRQNSGGLRACYEHALKRKPDLQYVSQVTARFYVKNTGN